tara:strand:+ start:568 stop:921 length:354 start_codon:yes stop_codon:yes gene_type:complete
MILIGNDIVEISKIKRFIEEYNYKFLDKVFSEDEQEFCNNRANPVIHLAGRFAGKEAVKKILLQIRQKSVPLKKIEIRRTSKGPPLVYLNKKLKNEIQVSISHTDKYATAVAVFEQK